jgi:hypothetical protein
LLASEAVDIAKQYGITGMDYSVESIHKAEEALANLHEEYRRTGSAAGVKGLASAFGAYVGECIRRSQPGARWERDHPVGGAGSYPLHWRGDEVVWPMAWCYRRITNGAEDNVWQKYAVLKAYGAGGPRQ